MIAASIPELLRWDSPAEAYDDVHERYVDLLAAKLAALCARLRAVDPGLAERLVAIPSELSSDALLRLLLAPEASFRLLYGAVPDEDSANFLLEALVAEQIREGRLGPGDKRVWTALGDAAYPQDQRKECDRPGRAPPLDFGSPFARTVDLSGRDRTDIPRRAPYSAEQQIRIRELIDQAMALVDATSVVIGDFVRRFNKVVILQADSEAPALFASGSNGRYVGRTFLANAHLEGIEPACIADALVHEGTHGLLYMSEQLDPWFTDPSARTAAPISSPWTGSSLTLPSFLQACFVWFALLNFWSLALGNGATEASTAHKYMSRAVRGFLRGPLEARIGDSVRLVSPHVLEDVARMQSLVRDAFASAA